MFLLAKKLIYSELKKKAFLIYGFVVNQENLSKVQIKDVVSRNFDQLADGQAVSLKVSLQCRS